MKSPTDGTAAETLRPLPEVPRTEQIQGSRSAGVPRFRRDEDEYYTDTGSIAYDRTQSVSNVEDAGNHGYRDRERIYYPVVGSGGGDVREPSEDDQYEKPVEPDSSYEQLKPSTATAALSQPTNPQTYTGLHTRQVAGAHNTTECDEDRQNAVSWSP